jgi:hypothetical protein
LAIEPDEFRRRLPDGDQISGIGGTLDRRGNCFDHLVLERS